MPGYDPRAGLGSLSGQSLSKLMCGEQMNLQAKWANTMNMGCEARQHERGSGFCPICLTVDKELPSMLSFSLSVVGFPVLTQTLHEQSLDSLLGQRRDGRLGIPEALAACSRWGWRVESARCQLKVPRERRPGSTAGMVQSFSPEEAGILRH